MHYKLYTLYPNSRYIHIEASCETQGATEVRLQLPAWRPGRYELGNFAKNVRNFVVFNEQKKQLQCQKFSKDGWIVLTEGAKHITVTYEYYAADLNAGSTYVDESQLYVNPVNCCLYKVGAEQESCTLEIEMPLHWNLATALPVTTAERDGKLVKTMRAEHFDRLADSPFIASAELKQRYFVLDGVEFHLWFNGECHPDWSKLTSDFFIFVNEQMQLFGSFPAPEFHFLFQILPGKFYHGVEHVDSTVIALGPGTQLMSELYNDLLGVSSHELFHAWNIKTIRPAEMLPYDFTKENYSRLGFVAEGVTTYYGDYILFRSGVWEEAEYWPEFADRLVKHFDTHARYFMSVADASFDTWLDGYVPGVPHRKTSIYHEGSILAFCTDMFIRKHSSNKYSLDDVMRVLWTDFAKAGKGYTDKDYKLLVEQFAGNDFSYYWNNYFYKANDYTPIVQEALDFIGCELKMLPAMRSYERWYGFRLLEINGVSKVSEMYYKSPAVVCGLSVGDEIVAVNGYEVSGDLATWMNYFESEEPVNVTVVSNGKRKELQLLRNGQLYYSAPQIVRRSEVSDNQKEAWQKWSGKKW